VGAPQTLYQHPQNAWVARFIGKGSILSLAARHPASQLESQQLHEGLAPDNTQPRQQVLVRPEHVMVGDNGLPAMVESCIFQGNATCWSCVCRTDST
jgi:iron(III) transport system ATP-binding protein